MESVLKLSGPVDHGLKIRYFFPFRVLIYHYDCNSQIFNVGIKILFLFFHFK